jgi:DNA-binding response OmpR family regulator
VDDAISLASDAVELQARLSRVLRRSRNFFMQSRPQIEDLGLCKSANVVHFRETAMKRTPHEMAMLEVMTLRRCKIMAKEVLLSQLYGGANELESKIIDALACKLSKKLKAAVTNGSIGTAWSHGHVLSVPGPIHGSDELKLRRDNQLDRKICTILLH